MKLIMGVISTDDTPRLLESLSAKGLTVTLVSTTGGFLKRGNDTILVGTPDERVDEVLDLIKKTCHPHSEVGKGSSRVEVGAATVFVLSVDQYHAY